MSPPSLQAPSHMGGGARTSILGHDPMKQRIESFSLMRTDSSNTTGQVGGVSGQNTGAAGNGFGGGRSLSQANIPGVYRVYRQPSMWLDPDSSSHTRRLFGRQNGSGTAPSMPNGTYSTNSNANGLNTAAKKSGLRGPVLLQMAVHYFMFLVLLFVAYQTTWAPSIRFYMVCVTARRKKVLSLVQIHQCIPIFNSNPPGGIH